MNRFQFATVALIALSLVSSISAQGDPSHGLYAEALARERVLRDPRRLPSLSELRSAVELYESLLRPGLQTDYEDRALWQAAGLATEAYDRFRQAKDLEIGKRLLRTLETTYPNSPLASRVTERYGTFEALSQLALLQEIEREVHGGMIRATLHFNQEVVFRSARLQAPDRLFFDFFSTDVVSRYRNATMKFNDDSDVITGIRLGRHPDKTTRVVLDTYDVDLCTIITLYAPYRIVVDCEKNSPATSLWTEPEPSTIPNRPPLMSQTNAPLSLARQLGLQITRVVIDPGHGGRDPGATSSAIEEADLVLDVAQRLARKLTEHPSTEVVMTRRSDKYLSLKSRTALANRVHGDLFLSIHANASRNPEARGVETYSLDFADSSNSEQIAAQENVSGASTMNDLGGLLEAIATNSKVDESRHFAAVIQHAMVNRLREADDTLPDLGVKQAPFMVLIGARMPSALAEISFLSNPKDSQLLSSDLYRNLVADALFDGILHYQRSLALPSQIAEQN